MSFDDFNKRMGQEIKRLRKAKGVTQKELGSAILRTESSIAKYEKGLVSIPRVVLTDIADFFGVDAVELLGLPRIKLETLSPYDAICVWLQSLGYEAIRDDKTSKVIALRDMNKWKNYLISDEIFQTLIDNFSSYSRFQVSELISSLPVFDSEKNSLS